MTDRFFGCAWTLAQLPVLLLDEALLAVAKPSGLLVHRGYGRDAVTASELARGHVEGAALHPAHRLDRGTSGVLLFARDAASAASLGRVFEQRLARKRYVALVRGVPPERFEVDHPVPRSEGGERVPARTSFRTLASQGRYAWVEAWPETGRFHQVRRHLKHVSHPIIGDVNYGKREHNHLFRERYGLERLALHAASLALPHPRDGVVVTLRAALPADLRGPLERAGFDAALLEPPDEMLAPPREG